MQVRYAPLPYREPWMGLPGGSRAEEQVGKLHREIEEYRRKKSSLESDWQEVQGCIKELDLVSQQRVQDIFSEAIRDAEYEIRDRLLDIWEIEDGAN